VRQCFRGLARQGQYAQGDRISLNVSHIVILNLFQDPFRHTNQSMVSQARPSACGYPAGTMLWAQWVLKQVQDDDEGEIGLCYLPLRPCLSIPLAFHAHRGQSPRHRLTGPLQANP
jgi:hypothetical protein